MSKKLFFAGLSLIDYEKRFWGAWPCAPTGKKVIVVGADGCPPGDMILQNQRFTTLKRKSCFGLLILIMVSVSVGVGAAQDGALPRNETLYAAGMQ